jgi:hypothetical protein
MGTRRYQRGIKYMYMCKVDIFEILMYSKLQCMDNKAYDESVKQYLGLSSLMWDPVSENLLVKYNIQKG